MNLLLKIFPLILPVAVRWADPERRKEYCGKECRSVNPTCRMPG